MNAETANEMMKLVIAAATPIIVAIAGKLAAKISTWIESKTTNETLRRIEHEAFEVVAAVGQAVATPIKEASADGKLTDEERQRIKNTALDALKSRLGDLPKSLLPDLQNRLSDAVEAAVLKIGIAKAEKAVAQILPFAPRPSLVISRAELGSSQAPAEIGPDSPAVENTDGK